MTEPFGRRAVFSRVIHSILLPFVSVLALCWSLWCIFRSDRAVAAGAALMSLLTGLAWCCGELKLAGWMEGGWGMGVLALVGGYALGAAVAFRGSASRGALFAAVAAATFTAVLGGVLFWDATRALDDILWNADPKVAEVIRAAAQSEAMRLLQLCAALVVAIGLMLTPRPRRPAVVDRERRLTPPHPRGGEGDVFPS